MAAIEASASADSSVDSHHSTEVGKATAAAFSCSTCKLVVTIGFEIEQVSSLFVSR